MKQIRFLCKKLLLSEDMDLAVGTMLLINVVCCFVCFFSSYLCR